MNDKDVRNDSDNFIMSIEDFDIVELEDRLELATRCNNNCSCGTKPN